MRRLAQIGIGKSAIPVSHCPSTVDDESDSLEGYQRFTLSLASTIADGHVAVKEDKSRRLMMLLSCHYDDSKLQSGLLLYSNLD